MEGSEKKLLNKVKQIIEIHDKHANQQGESFNIFTILRMERKEVDTHSRFIYELLNPKGLHGQGDIFLTLFVQMVLGLPEAENIRNPRREDVPESSDAKRRIDFTIESDQYLIGIEMKVDAGDQNKQMEDYHKSLSNLLARKDANSVKLFYLTLDGKSPSKKSIQGLEEGQYKNISFKTDVLDWVEQCIQQSATKSVLREALVQYKILLEKLTGISKGVQMQSADLILKSQENMKAALTLTKSLTSAQIKLQTDFWNELLHQLNYGGGKPCYKFEVYGGDKIERLVKNYYEQSKSNKHYGIRYRVEGVSKKLLGEDKELYFYINLYNALHYGFRLVSGDKVVELLDSQKDMLKNAPAFSVLDEAKWDAVANNQSDWICSTYGETPLNFNVINEGVISLLPKPEGDDRSNLKTRVAAIVADISFLIQGVEKSSEN